MGAKSPGQHCARRKITKEKHQRGIDRLENVLKKTHNAEELVTSKPVFTSLRKTLDSGQSVAVPGELRGIPMRMVVKALKCSWHVDGTWPLIGYDEAERHRICDPSICIVQSMHVSQHLHKDIIASPLYEQVMAVGTVLPCVLVLKEQVYIEPNSDTIAEAYARRSAGPTRTVGHR